MNEDNHLIVDDLIGNKDLKVIPYVDLLQTTQMTFAEAYESYVDDRIRKWLSSFNTDSATACFAAVQELKKKVCH